MGYLGATLTQEFTRARGADVSLRDVTIARDEKRGYRVRVTSCTRSAQRILGFWKSQGVELRPASGKDGWLLLARRSQASGLCGGCHTYWMGGDEKASIERLCLSPYVETFKLKGNKRFLPELRSRKYFSCFEIPMFYVYIYEHYMSISHIRIWVWYRTPPVRIGSAF